MNMIRGRFRIMGLGIKASVYEAFIYLRLLINTNNYKNIVLDATLIAALRIAQELLKSLSFDKYNTRITTPEIL